MLGLMVAFFASGYAPPGVWGKVLRHNQEMKIDASPFFYGDVENMTELENGLKELREAARLRQLQEEKTADSTGVEQPTNPHSSH